MNDAEHDASLAPGFHSLEILHRGAASTVYRALRDGDDAPVALKVMRDEDGAAEVERARELAGVAGIVDVLDHGRTSSGRAFAAMELRAEGDYGARLSRRHPLPVEEVLRVGRAVAAGLEAVHARGLLHHGVEPTNLLRSGESAVLADAGSVLPVDERPASVGPDPAVVHTPPEALRGEAVAPASDVYRLATTLWVHLAGHPPFSDGADAPVDPFDYRERVLGTDPPRLPRADLPGELRPVFERALARDPAQRYADAAEFGAALRGSGAGTVPEAEPETETETEAVSGSEAVPGTEPAPEAPGEGETRVVPAGLEQWTRVLEEFTADRRSDRPEDAWARLDGWTNAPQPRASSYLGPVPPTAPATGGAPPPDAPHMPPMPPPPPQLTPEAKAPMRQRPLFVAVAVVAIALAAVGVGAVALLRPGAGGELMERAGVGQEEPSPSASAQDDEGSEEPPAPPAGVVEELAPTDVVLEDSGDSVVLTWTEHSDGAASHHVVGGPVGSPFTNLADVPAGETEIRVNGFDVSQEYCFNVVAVLSVDEIATSDEVCTDRAGTW